MVQNWRIGYFFSRSKPVAVPSSQLPVGVTAALPALTYGHAAYHFLMSYCKARVEILG